MPPFSANSATMIILFSEECQGEQTVPVNSVKNFNSTQIPECRLECTNNNRIFLLYSGKTYIIGLRNSRIDGIDPHGRIMLCRCHETGCIIKKKVLERATKLLLSCRLGGLCE